MAVYENSRYVRNTLYKRKGWDKRILDIRGRFTFDLVDCKSHIWQSGDSLDNLAIKYYGNAALRWAILDANPKYKTEFDIIPGEVLSIPPRQQVLEIVNVN